MMSPCYKVLVKKIEGKKIILQVNYFNVKEDFDFDDGKKNNTTINTQRKILRFLAFSVHFFDEKGNFERFKSLKLAKEIPHEDLWRNEWVLEHAKEFYKTAICIDELKYLSYLYLEKLPEGIFENIENRDFESGKAFFENPNFPKCTMEIEVTNIDFLEHLSENMFFEVY